MILFLQLCFLALNASAKTPEVKVPEIKTIKYPVVMFFRGQVEIQSAKDLKYRPTKAKEILRENANIKTGANSSIDIAVDENRNLTVLANSEVSIPSISWDSGEIGSVVILSGEIFWQQATKDGNPVLIKSELFELIPPEAKFKISYHPTSVLSELKVFLGHVEFAAMNSENSVLLVSGKKVAFQGVREDGEVAYDVLLKGRKIPKGYLGKIEDIHPKEIQDYSSEELEKKKKAELQRLAAEKAKKQVLLPGQVCRSPAAKLNECSWTCMKNPKGAKGQCLTNKPGVSCVRRRCNANGVWGEETALESGEGALKCQSAPHVASCDY